MTATGDMLRRMDYMKRAKNTLGVKNAIKSTKIMECSSFVRSANERHDDVLQSAVRKMKADEKLFRDIHTRQLTSVKRFHNAVHSKSASVDDIAPPRMLPSSASDTRLFTLGDDFSTKRPGSKLDDRRGSFPLQSESTKGTTVTNQKRRHSVQPDTSKYGRSFRKLKDVIAPSSKARIGPEPLMCKSASSPVLDSGRSSGRIVLVSEAKE